MLNSLPLPRAFGRGNNIVSFQLTSVQLKAKTMLNHKLKSSQQLLVICTSEICTFAHQTSRQTSVNINW